jgi:hypothetical protein
MHVRVIIHVPPESVQHRCEADHIGSAVFVIGQRRFFSGGVTFLLYFRCLILLPVVP